MEQKDRYRTDLFVQNYYKEHPPVLRFDPQMDAETFASWKEKVRSKAYELMQFPDPLPENPKVSHLRSVQRKGYRVERLEIEAEPGLIIPFIVLIPDNADADHPAPGVLCCPGSGTPKESLAGEDFRDFEYEQASNRWKYPFSNAMAKHYAESGMVAVASDNPGVGELTGEYDRSQFALKLIMKGRNYAGLAVLYRWAILKWMKEQEYIDTQRLGLSGHSLGTESTMFISLLDDDVKAVVHNDFVLNDYLRVIKVNPPINFGPHWHIVPGMHHWFSFIDLLAAFAPGKLLTCEGGFTSEMLRIKAAYTSSGYPENYTYVYYPDFQDEKNRHYDFKEIPEKIEYEEYFKYANVNVEKHYFKAETAVPWMVKALEVV